MPGTLKQLVFDENATSEMWTENGEFEMREARRAEVPESEFTLAALGIREPAPTTEQLLVQDDVRAECVRGIVADFTMSTSFESQRLLYRMRS